MDNPAQPPAPPARRNPTRIALIVAAVVLLASAAVVVLAVTVHRQARDEHAKTACSLLDQADRQGGLDAVVSIIKALDEAQKSSNTDLVDAANTTSAASSLPFNDPKYRNPGDVQATAVRDWCRGN